jgi:hypothetical protein
MAKDIIKLTDADFEARSFQTLPGGKHLFKVNKQKSKIKPGANGAVLELWLTYDGPNKKFKGTNVIDNIGANVGWKIAQLLRAFGIDPGHPEVRGRQADRRAHQGQDVGRQSPEQGDHVPAADQDR